MVVLLAVLSFSTASFAGVFISVRFGPPPLPVYAQPLCPGPGYFWTPGYWAWNDDAGYYWVPGTWVIAPVGMLWTPGYWGWGGGFYIWHPGYWGPHVGFYGGINYGFGYTGVGFVGGEWRGREFFYNRSVTNVSVTNVTHVYNKTVIVNRTTESHVSYNGGQGGLKAQPRPEERVAERERHETALSTQAEHERMASQNRQNFAAENHGRPAVAATARPADFSSRSAISARSAGGEYHAPAMSPKEARGPANPGSRPFTPANSNNANRSEGRSTPSPQDRSSKSNEGFRPFTPPNSSGTRSTGGGAAKPAPSRESGSSKGSSNEGFRPFTPPSKGNSSEAGRGSAAPARGNESPRSESPARGNENAAPGSDRPANTSHQEPNTSHSQPQTHTESAPHAAPAPRQSTPKTAPHKSSPPRRDNNPPRHH